VAGKDLTRLCMIQSYPLAVVWSSQSLLRLEM
jgi:hypothetical protein